MTTHWSKTTAATLLAAALLGGCATAPTSADYAAQTPVLDLPTYFNGNLVAHGMFSDRGGKVVRRFVVQMKCTWNGDDGVLDEQFAYTDGKTERRVWRLKKGANGRFTGTADDVVGSAEGQASGNSFHWTYTLRLPVDDKVYDVQFDDWLFLIDGQVILNTARMSKFGLHVGDVTLTFRKP